MQVPSAPWPVTHAPFAAVRLRVGAQPDEAMQEVAEEAAISISYNGVPYAVMMATPEDLNDFAVGFSVAERIAPTAADIRAIDARPAPDGIAIDITLSPTALREHLATGRARVRTAHAGCGVCGSTDAALALAAAAPVVSDATVTPSSVRAAFAALERAQALNHATHAVHAAGWATLDGELLLSREDVGRHNALDKLIGAGLRQGVDFGRGLCAVTSRCSVEMAQKAAIAGMGILAAISGPTALAIRRAQLSGLTLIGFARGGSMTVYAGMERVEATNADTSSREGPRLA